MTNATGNNTGRTDGAEDEKRRMRIRPSGGYRTLRSFRTATVVYDGTVSFCERFMDKRTRTVDQMVQAGRSGRQNIAEGSRASATSSQTELRLINVARASLDELLLDFEDFLRQHRMRKWDKDDPQAKAVRAAGKTLSEQPEQKERTDHEAYARWLDSEEPAVVANALICLIRQANYLLDQQITALERQFVEGGGYSEQLATARIEKRRRDRSDPSDEADEKALACRLCGSVMVLRTARKGMNAGSQFWGGTGYPKCKGTLQLDGERQGGG